MRALISSFNKGKSYIYGPFSVFCFLYFASHCVSAFILYITIRIRLLSFCFLKLVNLNFTMAFTKDIIINRSS